MTKFITIERIHQIMVICLLLAMLPVAGFAQELQSDPLTITGKVEYLGQDGAYHDASYIWVEAWEKQALIDYKIAEGYTAGDGIFTFTHDTNGDPILNEDPGISESGTRDVFFKIRAQNEAAQVSADLLSGVLGTVYWFDSDTEYDVAGPTYSRNFQFDSTGDTSTHAAAFGLPGEVKSHRDWLWDNTSPHYARESVDVLFPDTSWPNFWGPLIYNRLSIPEHWQTTKTWENSPWAIAHEYGHAVHWSVRGGGLGLPIEKVPTGEEDPSNGTSDAGKGNHWVFSESAGGFALTEGWAEFFQCARYNDPTLVGGPGLESNDYWMGADGNGASGPNTDGTTGEIVEGAFASILWDLYDPANDDGVDGNFNNIWTVFANYHPDRVWSRTPNDDFYHYWNALYGQGRVVDEIFIDHGIPVRDDSYDSGSGNNGPASASSVGTVSGLVELADLIVVNPDWYEFSIVAEGDMSSSVSIAFSDPRGDLDLYVYQNDGTTLVVSSTSSAAGSETVSLDGQQAGTYKIRVVGKGDNAGTTDIYEGDFSPNYTLTIQAPSAAVYVYILVDLTGSYYDDLPVFKVEAPALIANLKATYSDIRFGLGKFEDYPISPFGSAEAGDKAYERLVDLTPDTNLVLNTISGLFTRFGDDDPESQLVALYQAATGVGQDLSGVGYPGASITPGQQANFRDGASKLILLWTDAPFHHPGDSGSIPYPGPSFDQTVDAIEALDPPIVMGISSGSGGLADLSDIAAATGAFAPAGGVDTNGDGIIDIPEGEPLVCAISSSGVGIGEAIKSLVEAAAVLPVADAAGPYTGGVAEDIAFNGCASFDPDGSIVLYEWDFESDGVFDFSDSGCLASHAYPGVFSGMVTLRVTDSDGNTATDTAPVEVIITNVAVTGVTREVNGEVLAGVSISFDGIGPVLSDQSGQYEIMATATGNYTIVAHKDGFRDRTQIVNIAGLGPEFAVTCNFQGQHGLIPCAPDIWYALDCVNLWLYPPNPETGLDIWAALDVINAWLYPVQ